MIRPLLAVLLSAAAVSVSAAEKPDLPLLAESCRLANAIEQINLKTRANQELAQIQSRINSYSNLYYYAANFNNAATTEREIENIRSHIARLEAQLETEKLKLSLLTAKGAEKTALQKKIMAEMNALEEQQKKIRQPAQLEIARRMDEVKNPETKRLLFRQAVRKLFKSPPDAQIMSTDGNFDYANASCNWIVGGRRNAANASITPYRPERLSSRRDDGGMVLGKYPVVSLYDSQIGVRVNDFLVTFSMNAPGGKDALRATVAQYIDFEQLDRDSRPAEPSGTVKAP